MCKVKCRAIIVIPIIAIITVIIAGVLVYRYYNCYDENWIIGKHYTEVIERYGAFDDEDYVEGQPIELPQWCYYEVKPERNSKFFDQPHVLPYERVRIYFDENGIAQKYDYHIGGQGG